jgi:hypothetical protein
VKKTFISYFLPFGFFLLLAVYIFGPTLIPPRDKIFVGWDLLLYTYYYLSYLVTSFKNGIIPFWNPHWLSGVPFLSQPGNGWLHPLNLLYFFLPINIAYSLIYFLQIIIAAILMYLLLRKKFGNIASLVSGTIFAFSGFTVAQMYQGHPLYLLALGWVPGVFGTTILLLETGKKRYFVLNTVFLSIMLLSEMTFIIIISFILIFFYFSLNFLRLFILKKKYLWKNLFLVIVSSVLSAGITAISFIPGIEYALNSTRSNSLPVQMINSGAYRFQDFKLLGSPFIQGYPFPEAYSYTGPGPNFFERCYFTGIVSVALFVLFIFYSIFNQIKRKKIDLFFIFTITSLTFLILMSMGYNTPLFPFVKDHIPLLGSLRIPPRYLALYGFIMALISGKMVSVIRNNMFKIIILILVVVELISFDKKFFRLQDLPTDQLNKKVVEFLQNNLSGNRMLALYPTWSAFQASYSYNAGTNYNIQTIGGYVPLLLSDYFKFIDNAVNASKNSSFPSNPTEIPIPNPYSPLIDFLSVKYILTEGNMGTVFKGNIKFKEVMSEPAFHIYENLNMLEKYRLVSNIKTYPKGIDISQIPYLFSDKDLSKTVMIEQRQGNTPDFQLDCKEGDIPGDVKIINFSANKIQLQANAKCNSILSTSEIYYPGWIAKVDGMETTIYKSNLAFRSIYMPSGIHTVEFYYRPTIYYFSGIISFISLMLVLMLIRFRKKVFSN